LENVNFLPKTIWQQQESCNNKNHTKMESNEKKPASIEAAPLKKTNNY
jgi:hypothetical protein